MFRTLNALEFYFASDFAFEGSRDLDEIRLIEPLEAADDHG